MPVTGFRCPETAPTAGVSNDPEHCFDHCPHQCLPSGILRRIWHETKHNVHKGDLITATALKGCPRKLWLERTRDYPAKPYQLYWSTRGGLYHGWLDMPADGVMTETRMFKQVPVGPEAPWWLSGAFDYYDGREHLLYRRYSLEDYKSQADKGAFYVLREGAKPEHIAQLNIYRWLMTNGRMGGVDGPELTLRVDKMVLHYVYMNQVISTGRRHIETSRGFAPPKETPLEVSREIIGRTKRNAPITQITYDIPAVPVWTEQEVLDYLSENGPEIVRAFRYPDYTPAGVMGDESNNWECGYCSVKELCDEIEQAKQPAGLPF